MFCKKSRTPALYKAAQCTSREVMDSRVGHSRRMVGEGLAVLPPASPLLHHSGHSPCLLLAETRSLPPSHWLDGGEGVRKGKAGPRPAVSVSHFPTRRAVRATFTPAPGRRLLQETLNQNGKLFQSIKPQ
jgi:hypothetical protein